MGYFPAPTTPVYVFPKLIRRLLRTEDQASAEDDILLAFCDQASRRIEEYCNRKFYIYRQSLAVDYPRNSFVLDVPEDLHTVVTITNGDGNTIPQTSGSVTNWVLYPSQEYPKYKIELLINSGKVWLFVGTPQQAITLDCLWGFPAVPNTGQYTAASAATVKDAAGQTAVQTTLLVPTGSLYIGQTLLIESEAELITDLTVGAQNDTLTVSRGVAGTTATTHAVNTAISTYLYHPTIVNCTYRLAAWLYRQKDSQIFDQIGFNSQGTITIPFDMPKDVEGMLKMFVRGHWR